MASRTIPASREGRDPFGGRQAEVEAHDPGPLFQEHGEHGVVLDEAPVDLAAAAGRLGPELMKTGRSRASQAASRSGSATAGRWQNTLTLNGRSVAARTRDHPAGGLGRRRRRRSSPIRPRWIPPRPWRGRDARHRGLDDGQADSELLEQLPRSNRIALGVCVRVPGDCGSGSL